MNSIARMVQNEPPQTAKFYPIGIPHARGEGLDAFQKNRGTLVDRLQKCGAGCGVNL